jgi:hypothetical protein
MPKACCARFWQQLSSKQQAAAGSKAAILQAGGPSRRHGAFTWAGELLLSVLNGWTAAAGQAPAVAAAAVAAAAAAADPQPQELFHFVVLSSIYRLENITRDIQARCSHAMRLQGVHS